MGFTRTRTILIRLARPFRFLCHTHITICILHYPIGLLVSPFFLEIVRPGICLSWRSFLSSMGCRFRIGRSRLQVSGSFSRPTRFFGFDLYHHG